MGALGRSGPAAPAGRLMGGPEGGRGDGAAGQGGDRDAPEAAPAAVERVACPFCESTNTVVISPFGSQLLMSQRRCQACGSYFEALRDDR
jgi:hypothetical protein